MKNKVIRSNKSEKHYCWSCKEVSLHTAQYSSDNKSRMKSTCLCCKHVSFWSVSVYPHPKEKDSNKQIDYIVKDIKGHLNNV